MTLCEVSHTCAARPRNRVVDEGAMPTRGSTMKYLLSVLIIAVVASQAMVWHSLVSIRDAIQQTSAIMLSVCGSEERPCQVSAHKGQIELGEIMVRSRIGDTFSCGNSRFNPCWFTESHEGALMSGNLSGPSPKADTAGTPSAP